MIQKKRIFMLYICMALALILAAIPLAGALALDTIPQPIDPQSWRFARDMTWGDWHDNTAFNWKIDGDKIAPQSIKKGLLVLCDFEDRPFVVCSPQGSEQMGNPLVGNVPTKDLVEFWESFLNDPQDHYNKGLNKGITISEFWQENTQGRWKIELDAVGVYRLPGYEFEYGLDTSMNAAADLPAGFTRRTGLNTLAINAAIADGADLDNYDFAFILHSGSTESGLWEEAGYMMFYDQTTIDYSFSARYRVDQMAASGIPIPAATWAWLDQHDPKNGGDGRGWWAKTRYVPWTSWWAASAIWSSSGSINIGGRNFRLSQQGETNGNGVFSHEFGHISTIADNYGSDINQRAYTGFWDLMCNGSMTGFGGNHTRYQIPNLEGGSVPAHMLTRTKRKLGFLDDNQLCNVNYAALREGAPVVTEIYSRTTPVGEQFGAIYPELAAINNKVKAGQAALGLRLYNFRDTKGRILSSVNWESETFSGANWYDNYTIEVVDQVGYDSVQSDHGVLICKNRETLSENVPYSWLINAHPGGLDTVDFYTPVGPKGERSVPQAFRNNDSNHLSAALFHAGKSVTPNDLGIETIRTGQTNDDYRVALNADGSAKKKSIADDTVNEYIDTYNNLHFYILDKKFTPGPYGGDILSYQVAVRHFEGQAVGGALEVKVAKVEAETPKRVAVVNFSITNTGAATDIIRVGVEGYLTPVILNDLYAVGAGQTVTVPVYVELPADIQARNLSGKVITLKASSETNGAKAGVATVKVEDLIKYNYTVYLAPHITDLLVGDTFMVDVMLEGDANYTQMATEITYDATLLDYAGYQDLRGWAAAVTKPAAGIVAVRSVPGMNMVVGAPCKPELRMVTLKFTVKGNFAADSIDTVLGFASLLVSPPGGVTGTGTTPGKAVTVSLHKYIEPTAGEIARQFVVDDPHANDYLGEGAFTLKYYEPNTIKTAGVVDPFWAGGGNAYAPTNRSDKKMKIYVIAVDFNDCDGDAFIPYGLQRNVFTSPSDGSLFDLSYPEVYYNTVFFGSQGLKGLNSSKFVWNSTNPAHDFKGLKQLVEEMSMGRFEVQVECLNERLATVQGLDPDADKWPWFHIDGPMLEYATQGPADCEDYRQFAKLHQTGINEAYRNLPGLDIEDIDLIYTIVPYNTHGYRSGLQGGSGLDTSFSYTDKSLMQRDNEYRHEPGVKTAGGRVVGVGVFGVKGIWGYTGNGFPASAPNPMSAVRVSLHEFSHNMGLFDDYSYGGQGSGNVGEATASGTGSWGMMGSRMGTATPDLFAWRKFRMGWINDDEIETVLPGEAKIINIRALGSYAGDGGTYTDDPAIKTRLVLIPKEYRTRDTFGVIWNNGWNPKKTDYDLYDWFTNPWAGGETYAVKSFTTFYTLECRKALGADIAMPASGGAAGGGAGVLVSYIANPTWETGHGAGGFKLMTGDNGLRVGGTAAWSDPHIGLSVQVLQSNVFYDQVRVAYTGIPTSAAQHVYQGVLTASDNYVMAGQAFSVDFDIFTLGAPAPNDSTAISSTVMRVATPLAVPGGICGFTMNIEFDAANLEYVSAGTAPFTYIVDNTNVAAGKLVVKGASRKMVNKDIILSLNFKAKTGAALGDYAVKGAITDVKLINYRSLMLSVGDPGFSGVGAFGNGTLSALYNTAANNTYSPGINSSGGKVTVGAVAAYTVSGQITCDTPGPAPGSFIGAESVVTLYNSSGLAIAATKSDWDGFYSIKGVPVGSGYYIKAEKPKYAIGQTSPFSVLNANVVSLNLRLDRTLYTVSGTIYGSDNSDGSNATPLAGAQVYIVNTGNCFEILGGPVTTNAQGQYTVLARAEHKQYAAVAVVTEGYSSHVVLNGVVKSNIGLLFGRNPADAPFGGTTQLGVNNIYNFAINGNVNGRNVTLTKAQDVQLRITPYSTANVYQLRGMDGGAVGAPLNSWGGMTTTRGDDVLRNVAPGQYYIEVSRSGYISSNTAPFIVGSTRAILRNNVGTHTFTMLAAGSGNTLAGTVTDAVSGAPLEGVRVACLPYSATYGAGVPIFTTANGTFSYLTVNTAKDLVFSKAGYISKTVYRAAGNASGLVIELQPDGTAPATVVETLDIGEPELDGEDVVLGGDIEDEEDVEGEDGVL